MIVLGDERHIEIEAGQGDENPVLIVREPNNRELGKHIDGASEWRGRKFVDKGSSYKERFIDSILIDCKNIMIRNNGSLIQLNKEFQNWKDRIPLSFKLSAWTQLTYAETFSEGDRKNSEGPSES